MVKGYGQVYGMGQGKVVRLLYGLIFFEKVNHRRFCNGSKASTYRDSAWMGDRYNVIIGISVRNRQSVARAVHDFRYMLSVCV